MALTVKRSKRTFDAEALQEIQKQASVQEIQTSAPRTFDENFPVFRVTPGEKQLIYVPNHVVVDDEGNETLRMDKPLIHTFHPNDNTWQKIRCSKGIVSEALGLDGECAICDRIGLGFELANAEVEQKCKTAGLDKDNKENPDVKDIRSKAFGNKVFDNPSRNFTFPIVVIESEVNDKNKLVPVVKGGNIDYNVFYYTVTENQMNTKLLPALDSLDDDDDNAGSLGGRLYTVSFGQKDAAGNPPSAMIAVKDMGVSIRKLSSFDQLKQELDKASEEFTPMKAIEVLPNNQFIPVDEVEPVMAEAEITVNEKIALYNNASNGATPGAAGIQKGGDVSLDSLTGGATASQTQDTPMGVIPEGATDKD